MAYIMLAIFLIVSGAGVATGKGQKSKSDSTALVLQQSAVKKQIYRKKQSPLTLADCEVVLLAGVAHG